LDRNGGDALAGVLCSQCGEEVYRILEGRCFPCWRNDNLVTVEEIETKAMQREASAIDRKNLRQLADEVAQGKKGMWIEEVICHHCQNPASMVVVNNGGNKPSQVKVLCTLCKTYWV
jgi:hypothetical protein